MRCGLLIIGMLMLFTRISLAEGSDCHSSRESHSLDSLFEALSSSTAVESDFVEWRHNALRRVPSRFAGIMRWDDRLGLSLEYKEPRAQIILIREDAVWRKTGERNPQAMTGSAESDLLRATLLQVFSFDRVEWEKHFEWDYSGAADSDWEMKLVPLSEGQGSRLFHSITIKGKKTAVTHLTIGRDHRSRIEIEIHHSRSLQRWDQQILSKAFFEEAEKP